MQTVKESSDELNPSITTSAFVALPAHRGRSAMDNLALVVATSGVGLIPIAPGTWGSLLGVGDQYFYLI